jgi:hypothetical protein
MSVTKTCQTHARAYVPSRPSEHPQPAASPSLSVDTSNLSPGAAARFEKLMRSIDDFTEAVQSRSITLPDRK